MNNDDNKTNEPAAVPPPLEADSQKNALELLLNNPLALVRQIDSAENLTVRGVVLLIVGLFFYGIFGVAIGFFGGWDAASMTAAKVPLIALCSILLCLPSLYIFSCVGGMPMTLQQTVFVACCVVAMTGLLLVGLAPVSWLFAVSTQSSGFFVLLNFIVWLIAMGFTMRFLDCLKTMSVHKQMTGIKWWTIIYILVSLQMTTTMRPLLYKPDAGWWKAEKKFFLIHFGESFDGSSKK